MRLQLTRSDQFWRSWSRLGDSGVPFQMYMYVHPLIGTEFHKREGEGHVFKVSPCLDTFSDMHNTYVLPLCINLFSLVYK